MDANDLLKARHMRDKLEIDDNLSQRQKNMEDLQSNFMGSIHSNMQPDAKGNFNPN